MTETITTTEVLLRCWFSDGNDPIEASVNLPIVPRIGDTIEIWNKSGPFGGNEDQFEVLNVVLCAWAPERVEIHISTEGLTPDDVRSAFDAAERNDQP